MSNLKPNSLAVRAPHLRGEWSPENSVSFEDATCGEHTKYKWVCPKRHPYEAAPYNRVAKKPKGCPECSGRRTSIVNSLATRAPWLECEWHPDNKEKFYETAYSSNKKCKWVCRKYKHVWTATPANRTGKMRGGCPDCSHRRVSELNSLATRAPWLECEWHPDNKEKFHEVAYRSGKRYKWKCSKCQHVWMATPCNRTALNPRGCSGCVKRQSKAELAIFDAVKVEHPDSLSGVRGLLRNQRFELDIYVPSNKKAIEFDGVYWHSTPRTQRNDALKNQQCLEVGIQLLRIPEVDYKADPQGVISKVLAWLAAP